MSRVGRRVDAVGELIGVCCRRRKTAGTNFVYSNLLLYFTNSLPAGYLFAYQRNLLTERHSFFGRM